MSVETQEIHWVGRDQTAQAFGSLNRSLRDTTANVNRARDEFGQFVAGGRVAERQLRQLPPVFSSVSRAAVSMASQASASARGMASAFTSAGRSIASEFGGAVRNATGLLGGLTAAIGTAGAAAAAFSFGKLGVDMNLAVQNAEMAAATISGSNKAAKAFVAGLREEAETSKLTFAELLPLSQSLAAAFNSVYGAEGLARVRGTLRTFGDVAQTLGASAGSMQLALNGFQQLLTSDTPTMEDIKQISENLPGSNALGIVRQTFGATEGDTLKEAGVTGAMVAEAILAGMEEKFGGAQQRMAKSLPVLLSNFADTAGRLAGNVTEAFLPQLTAGVDRVLQAFQSLAGSASFVQALAVPFEFLGKALEYVGEQAPKFTAWLEEILTRENVLNFLADVAGTFLAIRDSVGEAWQWLTTKLGPAFKWIGGMAYEAADFVVRGFNGIASVLQYLSGEAGKVFGLVAGWVGNVMRAVDDLTRSVRELAAELKKFGFLGGQPAPASGGGAGAQFGLSALAPAPASGGNFGSQAKQFGGWVNNAGNAFSNEANRFNKDPFRVGLEWLGKGASAIRGWSQRDAAARSQALAPPPVGAAPPPPVMTFGAGIDAAWARGASHGLTLPQLQIPDLGSGFDFNLRREIGKNAAREALDAILGPSTPKAPAVYGGGPRTMLYGQQAADMGTVRIAPGVVAGEDFRPDRSPVYRDIPAAPGYPTGNAYATPGEGLSLTVNAPIQAVLPPEMAARLLNDSGFLGRLRQWLLNELTEESYRANPGVSY